MYLVTSNINGFFENMQTWGEKGAGVNAGTTF
jgi:hypothetical protein